MTVLFVLGLALACALAFAQRAAAAGPSLFAEGLHISTGAIVDPNDRVWVADHNAGFCRIKPSADGGPGVIDHPQNPGEDVDHTCLGGLLPEAATGPDAAGQPAFIDPSPEFKNSGDEFVLIPDGASPSSDVVRADWNPDTGLFQFRDIITMDADTTEQRPRPVAVSAAPDGNAYVVFQRSGTVQRIVNPESPNPTVDLVAATSDGRGASAVAATYGPGGPLAPPRVVVAEAGGLREVTGTATDPAAPRTTEDSVYDLPAGAPIVSALTYEIVDPAAGAGDLFAGTADSLPAAEGNPNADRVLRWTSTGEPTVLATGLSTVGGFGPRHNGGLLVLDDPALVLPAEPLGTGRMHSVGDSWARITDGPPAATSVTTPTFTIEGEGARQCSVDGGSPQACDTSFTVDALPEGNHMFAVRADGVSVSEVRRFKVDTTAPSAAPKVVSPANGTFTSARPYYEFEPATGEDEGTYECKIVAGTDPAAPGEFRPCEEGRAAESLAAGQHTMVIRARDAAGNPEAFDETSPVSDPVTFTVGTPEPGPNVDPDPSGPLAGANSVVRLADGLHIATGALQAPDRSLWVTDHNAGLCRVSKPTFDGAGHIEHPQIPGQAGPNTCLGGLLPDAREGADAAGQPVLLDPTPRSANSGDEVAIVPDGSRPSTLLFRAQWNPGSERFDPLDTIVTPLDGDRESRPTAVALGPDPDGPNEPGQPDVFVVRKSDNQVVRVQNAASTDPQSPPRVDVVGRGIDDKNFEAIAVGQRTVGAEKQAVIYIGEPAGGVTRLIPNGTPNGARSTLNLPEFTGSVGALAYDKARDLLYVGTADAAGDPEAGVAGNPNGDRVFRFRVTENATGEPTLVNEGPVGEFNMVGGLAVRPSGQVLVTDDVALTLPDEPMGTGRLYQIGSPQAHITSGPTDDDEPALDKSFTSSPTPEFTVAGDGAVQCALREKDVTPTAEQWTDCGTGEESTVSAAELAGGELADGEYVLSVRAKAAEGTTTEAQNDTSLYVPESLPFTVDDTDPGEPNVTVKVSDGENPKSSAAPWFTFTPASPDLASDLEWRCSLNGEDAAPCHPGRTYPLKADGTSQLDPSNDIEVKAVDKAGNESAVGTHTWDADTSIPTVTINGGARVRQNTTTATFAFSVADGDAPGEAQTGCRLDGAPWKLCERDGETFTGLAEGTHVFKAHARDAFGNMSPTAIQRVVVDRTGPALAINGIALQTGPNVTATFSVAAASQSDGEGATRFFSSLDGEPAVESTSPTRALSNLSNGQHTLTVYALDDLGNRGATETVTFTVAGDAPAPPAQPAPPAGGPGPGAGGGQGRGQGGATGGQGRGRGGLATVQLAPAIQVTSLRAQGLPVTVRPQAGATTVRIRVFRVTGVQGRAAAVSRKAAAKRKLVATVYRATPQAKTYRFKLKERKLRALKPGRYVVEIRAGKSRTTLGTATTRTIVVRGR